MNVATGTRHLRLKARLGGLLPQMAQAVHELSLEGIELSLRYALAEGQVLPVELVHPILPEPVTLEARVRWCELAPGHPHPRCSLGFLAAGGGERVAVRRIQAAELSQRVVAGGFVRGFLRAGRDRSYAVYDASTVKVATLRERDGLVEAAFLGARPEETWTVLPGRGLEAAVGEVLELETIPRILPPEHEERAPVAPSLLTPPLAFRRPQAEEAPGAAEDGDSSRGYHQVHLRGRELGCLGMTLAEDAWTAYDVEWGEVATIAPGGEGFKVVPVSSGNEGPLEYMIARSFPGAVALAYGLDQLPSFSPGLPPELAEGRLLPAPSREARAPRGARSRAVRAAGRVCGSLVSLGPAGSWSVRDLWGGQVAMIAADAGVFRVILLEGGALDSLAYMVARDLPSAVALALELEQAPRIDAA